MSEPRRLTRSGGQMQKLLESASLDRGSEASLRRALELSTTAGAFARPADEAPKSPPVNSLSRAVAKWVVLGAAAGGILALGASQILGPQQRAARPDRELALQPPTSVPAAASPVSSPDIAAEPLLSSSAVSGVASGSPALEAGELEVVRSAIRRGDHARALEALNAYDQTHPQSTFAAQSLALRIFALRSSGKAEEAKALTREFQKRFPSQSLEGEGMPAPRDGAALGGKR